jgi:hypothetical protein
MGKTGVIAAAAMVVATGIGVVAVRHRRVPPPPIVTPVAAAQPATRPARVRPPHPTFATYLDAVRASNPAVAATQPLGVPVELADAAHVVLRDPVYVDPTGNLWVTRRDGQPTEQLLAKPPDGPEYVVRDRPVFVHWMQDDGGNWTPSVVVAAPGGASAGYDLITAAARRRLAGPRPYRWAAAYSVPALGKFVVPTDVGVSVFDVAPVPAEHYHALPGGAAGTTTLPVTVLDSRGVLAWAPWDNGHPGSAGVARFVDDHWIDLPAADWPAEPGQLSVLLDGSVLRIAAGRASTAPATPVDVLDEPATTAPTAAPPAGPADGVTLSIGQLDTATVDAPHVEDLIAQLSDPDPDKRQAAFDELARYGPALWPVLDRDAAAQPPEGQVRIRQLLRGKLAPALGGMTVIDDRLAVAHRQPDGTTVLFAPAGVQIPTDREDDPQSVTPAWVVVRPDGRIDRPLPPALVADQRPDACTLRSAADEWLVVDAAGPRRFFGNALVPMLPPAERRFTEFVALAARHRWVFRDPTTGETLLIDPTIADPTPRLPVWVIDVPGGEVGWDDHDNPAVRRGRLVGPNAPQPAADGSVGRFALGPDGWTALGPKDTLHTDGPPPAVTPATVPTTGPTTVPTAGPPLLTTADGTTYFDGRAAIEWTDPAGHRSRWPLPPQALGSPSTTPVLMRTDDGLLFLYNAPGRLLRLRPTVGGAEPFKLEATFTADLPDDERPARVWLDPAGRIDFACGGDRLVVTFPAGRMPKPIADMIDEQRP